MAPVADYFRGSGNRVLESMIERYGPEAGKRVFYATAEKHKEMKPASERPKHGPKINPMRSTQ